MGRVLYKEIINDIEDMITRQAFKDSRLPTERNLAKKYGVSRVTTRLALNELEKKDLIFRIQGKGTFIKEKTISSCSKNIAIIHSQYTASSDFFSSILHGVFTVNEKLKYNLNFFPFLQAEGELGEKSEFIEKIKEKKINIAVILSPLPKDFINWLVKNGIFTVTAGFAYEGAKINSIVPNNFKGGYLAAEYLINKGYKNIGIVLGPVTGEYGDVKGSSAILRGYESALIKHKMIKNEKLIKKGSWDRKTIPEEVNDLLESKIDAVICGAEGLLKTVLGCFYDKVLRVPEDINVVSFCPLEVAYPFTTVKIPVVQIGEAAVILINSFANKGKTACQNIILEPELQTVEKVF
ncbi:MAG: GntR family transcriptional regulator [Candidatus Firestonebacteria bacterium]